MYYFVNSGETGPAMSGQADYAANAGDPVATINPQWYAYQPCDGTNYTGLKTLAGVDSLGPNSVYQTMYGCSSDEVFWAGFKSGREFTSGVATLHYNFRLQRSDGRRQLHVSCG